MVCYRFKEVYVLNVFMVFVVEYVIIVFRSLKPRGSNPVSSPTARPDSRLKVLINCWWVCVLRS